MREKSFRGAAHRPDPPLTAPGGDSEECWTQPPEEHSPTFLRSWRRQRPAIPGRQAPRGDVWLYTFRKPDKRRPVVVLTRPEVIGLLHTVTVAPVTSTIHGAPSEVIVGPDEGLKHACAVNLDHLQTVQKSGLHAFLGRLSDQKLREMCRAVGIALGCR